MSFAENALFDIIIVGSCAGGVLAARLSDNPNLRILLLEAGPDHRTATMSPEMKAVNPMALWADPTWTWPDCKVSRTMLQAPRHYPIGRGAGGGSAINGMGAIRPSPQDFAEWEDVYGCEGWGWNTMLPCLRRLESDPHGTAWEPEAHGVEGPIPIFRQPLESWGPVARAMRLSALEKGYGESPDINSPTASGCVSFAYNVDPISLQRVSVNDGYIEKTRGVVRVTWVSKFWKRLVEERPHLIERFYIDIRWTKSDLKQKVKEKGQIVVLTNQGLINKCCHCFLKNVFV